MIKIWKKWKTKWNVESDKRMAWIFLVFAITGMLTVVVRKGLFEYLGIDIENGTLRFLVKLIAIYFVYQLMLFTVGTIMGEGKFVRWFIAKMNKRLIPKKKK